MLMVVFENREMSLESALELLLEDDPSRLAGYLASLVEALEATGKLREDDIEQIFDWDVQLVRNK